MAQLLKVAIHIALVIVSSVHRSCEENQSRGIVCEIPCNEMVNSVQISDGLKVSFSAYHTTRTPWAKDTERTAPKPRNLWMDWYLVSHHKIALKVHWMQKVSDIKEGTVNGYYLRYGLQKLKVDLTLEKTSKPLAEDQTLYVQFVYPCIGNGYVFLKPYEKMFVKLFALPMPTRGMVFGTLYSNITIPGRSQWTTSTILRTTTSILARATSGPSEWTKNASITPFPTTLSSNTIKSERQPDYNAIDYALGSAIGLFTAIMVLFLISMIAILRRKTTLTVPGEILIVADTNAVEHLKIAGHLVTKLRRLYHIRITCNWENQRAIEEQAFDWYRTKISTTDLIIFILEMSDFRNQIMENVITNCGRSDLLRAFRHVRNMEEPVPFAFLVLGDFRSLRSSWRRKRGAYTVYDTCDTFGMFLTRVTGKKTSRNIELIDLLQTNVPDADQETFISSQSAENGGHRIDAL